MQNGWMVDLSALLALPEPALHPVSLPAAQRDLRWVATSELEDPTPFLEGGELLLTTGLATTGWDEEWWPYVSRLAAAGVVGLALGVGLTHAAVPEALVRAARDHDLNLIEVPRETSFVSISRAAAGLIARGDEAEARVALEMQRRLTTAAMQDRPEGALIEALGDLLDGAAALVAADGPTLIGPAGPRQHEVDPGPAADILEELGRIRPQGLRATSTSTDSRGTSVLVPIGLRGRPTHYLWLSVPGRLTALRRTTVATAVALLGLVAEQRRERLESRRRLWRTMRDLLVGGDLEAALGVAAAAGAPTLPERLRVLRAAGAPDDLDDALTDLEREAHLVVGDSELWVAGEPDVVAGLAGALAGRGLRVGLGHVVTLAQAREGHVTAGRALERATARLPIVSWDDVLSGGAVGLVAPDVAASFSVEFLAGLDEAHLETLDAFLRHHGSRLKVAEDLGLHRNTVRNRLDHAQAIIGRSLDDADTRVSLWLALRGRDARERC